MKVVLDIPKWADKHRLVILSGLETVAMKEPFEDFWRVKEVRCSRCAECCLNTPPGVEHNEEGACIHLLKEDEEYRCGLGTLIPYNCVLGVPEDFCTVTYRRVKI